MKNTKKISHLLVTCLVFLSNSSWGQMESANWYFGYHAGLSFSETEVNPLSDGKLRTNEGCATISNNKGELLFYTDGVTVWDRNHCVMPNGKGLLGNISSTQSAIIVPKPDSKSIYYIFTVANAAQSAGLRYTEVNMELNNGLGDITLLKNIFLMGPSTEKISAVRHANGSDFWVASHTWNGDDFLVFEVNDSGVVQVPVVSKVGSFHGGEVKNSIGYLKIAPNGKKLALAKWHINSTVEVFDFDTRTGMVSNPILLDEIFRKGPRNGAYGIEFSPDGNLLYVTDLDLIDFSSLLYQMDLHNFKKTAIIDSVLLLYEGQELLSGIQLAIDGRIYISNGLTSFLDYIEKPNVLGLGCNYVNKGTDLNEGLAVYGLPPFVQSSFIGSIECENVCLGEMSVFGISTDLPLDEVHWDFGDGTTSGELEPEHQFVTTGTFEIKVKIQSGYNTYFLSYSLEVFENPVIDMANTWTICAGEEEKIYVNSLHDSYLWSTGETAPEIMVNTPGVYSLTVFDGECSASKNIKVIMSGRPDNVNISKMDWTIFNNSIEVRVNGVGNYEYSLDGVNYQNSAIFKNLNSGSYNIYIKDKIGCGIMVKEVHVFDYPKYFTPNGDGYKDL
ncbi:PKD domain-containing protein [Aestuariivivens sediminis]|uniref:PKD domain-containing protein n=1 Tax=Aestuariivivens sediminis TaxID=2913557 RepID=UPI001F57F519|nr:PKD domain-containing protein [Aestuariivivens sediminis]